MRGFVHKRTRKRKNGTSTVLYYAVIEAPRRDGKRRQDWGKGYGTRREAERALRARIAAVEDRTYVPGHRATLGAYVVEEWLPLMRDRLKPTTRSSYQRMLQGYVIPRLGHIRLQDLT